MQVGVLWWSVVVSKVREVFLGWGLRDGKKVESNVTAAYATIVMNRGGGTRNLKTCNRGNLMSPCHTLSHPQVTCDKSHNMSH
jgi:hypothetical protein